MSGPDRNDFDKKRFPDKMSFQKAVDKFLKEYESEKEIKKDGDNSANKR